MFALVLISLYVSFAAALRETNRCDQGNSRVLQERHHTSGTTPSRTYYVARTIEGKGIGLIATHDITEGEEITRERPILALRNGFSAEVATAAVNSLSESNRVLFNELSDSYHLDGNGKTALGIFMTNALQLGSNGNMGGLFPRIARINHSCRPNLNYHYNAQTGTGSMHALRPILAGEELTQAYTPPCQTIYERQSYLSQCFNFKCTCSSCSLKSPYREQSDERRSSIRMLSAQAKFMLKTMPLPPMQSEEDGDDDDDEEEEGAVERSKVGPTVAKILDNVKRRIVILEQEDLANPLQLMLCEYDAYLACRADNQREAVRWLTRALDHAVLAQGSDSPTSTFFRDLMSRMNQ